MPKCHDFEPLFAAAELDDYNKVYEEEEHRARLEAKSAARAASVSLSSLTGRKPAAKTDDAAQGSSLMAHMKMIPHLSKAAALFEKANLGAYIDAQARLGDAVVLAPTNEALSSLSDAELKRLTAAANMDDFKILMRGHIAPAMYDEDDEPVTQQAYDKRTASAGLASKQEERPSAQPGHSLAIRDSPDENDSRTYVVLGSNHDGRIKGQAPLEAMTISFNDILGKIQPIGNHLMPE